VKKGAISTKKLTQSFGWDRSDSFTQHDVQELCRVLFDCLEDLFQSSKQENLLNSLYQGTMIDYVQCLRCQRRSERPDTFLDISLDIHNVNTLEAALQKFIEPGFMKWLN
jgi:ubiquitin carboxyl-terminal hydrolase 47